MQSTRRACTIRCTHRESRINRARRAIRLEWKGRAASRVAHLYYHRRARALMHACMLALGFLQADSLSRLRQTDKAPLPARGTPHFPDRSNDPPAAPRWQDVRRVCGSRPGWWRHRETFSRPVGVRVYMCILRENGNLGAVDGGLGYLNPRGCAGIRQCRCNVN